MLPASVAACHSRVALSKMDWRIPPSFLWKKTRLDPSGWLIAATEVSSRIALSGPLGEAVGAGLQKQT